MALLDVGAHAPGRAVLGEVAGAEAGAQLRRQRAQAILAAGDEHELGAVLAGEQAGGRLADPARGAGDDGDGHWRTACARNRAAPTSAGAADPIGGSGSSGW